MTALACFIGYLGAFRSRKSLSAQHLHISESSAGAITSNLSYLASKMAISSNAQFISGSTTYQQLGFIILDLLKEGGDSAVINFLTKNRENVTAILPVMIAASAIGAGVGKSNIPYLSHPQREEAGSLFMQTCLLEQIHLTYYRCSIQRKVKKAW